MIIRRRLIAPLLVAIVLLATACAGAPLVGPPVAPPTSVASTPAATVAATATIPAPTAAPAEPSPTFDGAAALALVEAQVALGPRYPGSAGHVALRDWIVAELAARDIAAERQPFTYRDFAAENIIGRANVGRGPIIILGAHFDTRRVADQSSAAEAEAPVPGANDGGSGVAVLLEMARVLDFDAIPHEIWFAFFDAEDNGDGGIRGWDWIAGSRHMAANLPDAPDAYAAMILFDMVGDADQQFFYEGNSTPALREALWRQAAALGFEDSFIPELRYTMIDDHVPFREAGIDAVDIIDFDYPYWHTVEDTVDKLSAESLYRAGHTVEVWLETRP